MMASLYQSGSLEMTVGVGVKDFSAVVAILTSEFVLLTLFLTHYICR